MRQSNFALRLQPSLLEEARKAAEAEGVALNQLINVAVAEKLSALPTADYFRERAARGDTAKALAILDRAGIGNPALEGDELPAGQELPVRPRGLPLIVDLGDEGVAFSRICRLNGVRGGEVV